MRKIQIAISSDLCIRLTWNLTGSCGQQQRLREWSRMLVKQFQDGGRPPFWKSIYHHISVKNHRILMKFCTQQHILNWMNVTWSKMKKFHWTDSEFDRTYFLYIYKYTAIYKLKVQIKCHVINIWRSRHCNCNKLLQLVPQTPATCIMYSLSLHKQLWQWVKSKNHAVYLVNNCNCCYNGCKHKLAAEICTVYSTHQYAHKLKYSGMTIYCNRPQQTTMEHRDFFDYCAL